jgi:hypothetical protein
MYSSTRTHQCSNGVHSTVQVLRCIQVLEYSTTCTNNFLIEVPINGLKKNSIDSGVETEGQIPHILYTIDIWFKTRAGILLHFNKAIYSMATITTRTRYLTKWTVTHTVTDLSYS